MRTMQPDCANCEKTVAAKRFEPVPGHKRYCFECPGTFFGSRFGSVSAEGRIRGMRSCRRTLTADPSLELAGEGGQVVAAGRSRENATPVQ